MNKEFRMKLETVFDILGEILALVVAILWVISLLNINFGFLEKAPRFIPIAIEYTLRWATLILVGVVGVEFSMKRNIIIRIFFYLLLAVLIIFNCFPQVYNQLISYIGGNTNAVLLFF